MKNEKPRKEKLSIYLIKSAFGEDRQSINLENANPPYELATLESSARLYVKREIPKDAPIWTKLFRSDPNVPENAFGRGNTVGAVSLFESNGRRFLISFGSGHHLIKEDAVERDFGLRVTLNSVVPEKLRSLDKASYDHNPLNSRTQSTKDVDIFDLNVDSELDIVYAVTGISNVPEFGSTVTGRDAFTISVEVDLKGIPAILAKAKEKYEAKLPPQFEWIDNITRVKDLNEIEILDLLLDDELQAQSGNCWLGEPEVVDWESQYGYSFDLLSGTPRHVVLSLKDLVDYLGKKGHQICVETLKAQSIHINNSEYQAVKTWSAYRCLYAELPMGSDQYILRNGLWFKAEQKYVASVAQYLKDVKNYPHALPIYAHDREDDYNAHVVSVDTSFHLMDKKTAQIGGKYDKVEFCDLIKDGRDLIHVKYYRSSSTLSHLFAQGYVAAEAFIKDFDFRVKVNSKLPKAVQLTDVKARPDPTKYRVVYGIATSKTLPKELPFFSQITLKNAIQTLRALNFEVQMAQIQIDPVILVKKKIKPKKAP